MEPFDNTVPYKLGQMDACIGNIQADVASIKADVKILLARNAEQRGSKATVAAWGSGGVGLGGLVVAALQFFMGGNERPAQAASYPQPPPVTAQPYSAPRVDDPVNPPMRF